MNNPDKISQRELRNEVKELRVRLQEIRDEGYLNGYDVGYRKGWTACAEAIMKEVQNESKAQDPDRP